MRFYFLEIKQCPAVSVVPVLTPYHPFSNSLFVFFHNFFVTKPYLSFFISSSICLVVTIFLNRSFFIAKAAKAVIAYAVEKFGLAESPELLPHYCLRSSYFEKAFIWLIKV
jgi:hypothetical protein